MKLRKSNKQYPEEQQEEEKIKNHKFLEKEKEYFL